MFFFLAGNENNDGMHTQLETSRAKRANFNFRARGHRELTSCADCTSPALYSCARLYRARGARWRSATVFTSSSRFSQRERPPAGLPRANQATRSLSHA